MPRACGGNIVPSDAWRHRPPKTTSERETRARHDPVTLRADGGGRYAGMRKFHRQLWVRYPSSGPTESTGRFETARSARERVPRATRQSAAGLRVPEIRRR
ncbi:unnamed protein product [Lampetra fluviatilis]